MSKYLSQFLSLRCAGDVMNAVAPLNRADKEITESMAAMRHLKAFFLDKPMERNLVDLCAGNALTSILAVHLLPVKEAIAIDRTPRERPGHRAVKRWRYLEGDLYSVLPWVATPDPAAVVAVHACCNLATQIIDRFKEWPWARLLVLSPCCHGKQEPRHAIPAAFRDRVSKYEAWAWWLAERAGGELYVDQQILSPCNAVIVAKKVEP